MKSKVSATFQRLAKAFQRPIVVEGQGAPLQAQGLTIGDWDVPTAELDASAFLRAHKELWDGIERRRAMPDTVGMADDNSYGADWDDVKTVEMVQIDGLWHVKA